MSNGTHIAGLRIEIDNLIRQRCAWCGLILLDYDWSRLAFREDDSDKYPATWTPGVLVAIDNNCSWEIEGGCLPDDACARKEKHD